MAKMTTRDELLLLLDEIDRGELDRSQLEELVNDLNLMVSDAEALEILENDELDADEVADQLVGYEDRDA